MGVEGERAPRRAPVSRSRSTTRRGGSGSAIRDHVTVRIRDRFDGEATVTCVIPGHDRDGEELVADELRRRRRPASPSSYRGVCGYGSTFSYSG